MPQPKDDGLYGIRKQHKLAGDKEISSSTTLSFTSQLSSLINTAPSKQPKSSRHGAKKEDIFATHNRNLHKRAKRDLEESHAFEQKHTTKGEALDSRLWGRSKRKMEEKARLYAAMKRGDVEDADERYAVDFDRKWAERQGKDEDSEQDDEDDLDDDTGPQPLVEYTDEFGRARQGTAAEAAKAERVKRGQLEVRSDRFTARPSAPANIIYGDTIQSRAFNPDEPVAAQMEALAKKRDKSLTPPPEQHFDGSREIRTKGTAFYQFSEDADERQKQMEGLEVERLGTERKRKEREEKLRERKRLIEERRREVQARRGKRKADEFLDQLGEEIFGRRREVDAGTEMTESVEGAVAAEREDEQE